MEHHHDVSELLSDFRLGHKVPGRYENGSKASMDFFFPEAYELLRTTQTSPLGRFVARDVHGIHYVE